MIMYFFFFDQISLNVERSCQKAKNPQLDLKSLDMYLLRPSAMGKMRQIQLF